MCARDLTRINSRTFVGGCRASPGGLHLGHVYGCMVGVPQHALLFFVLSDCLSGEIVQMEPVIHAASDALAVSNMLQLDIRVVRESVLRPHLTQTLNYLLRGLSFRLLAEAHPPKAQAKSLGFSGTVDDFLFPVHQAAYLLGLDCKIACYNDDNSRYVDLARKAARRCNKLYGTAFSEHISLLAKDPPRLRSWDGRRMAKGYNNVLHLSATLNEIHKFAERLVGRASSGETEFDTRGQGELERLYVSLFGFGSRTCLQSVVGLDRISLLADTLTQWCKEIQKVRPQENATISHIQHSEKSAVELIQSVSACMHFPSNGNNTGD